jgi:hypothetical protein
MRLREDAQKLKEE